MEKGSQISTEVKMILTQRMTPGSEWYTNQLSTSYELQVKILSNCLIARVTSSILRTSYQLLFIAQVASYFLHTGYELLFVARVTRYIYCKSYQLMFILRVTSSCLLYELRVLLYCTSCELLLIVCVTSYSLFQELRVTFGIRVPG